VAYRIDLEALPGLPKKRQRARVLSEIALLRGEMTVVCLPMAQVHPVINEVSDCFENAFLK
jgi:hypothetical protein